MAVGRSQAQSEVASQVVVNQAVQAGDQQNFASVRERAQTLLDDQRQERSAAQQASNLLQETRDLATEARDQFAAIAEQDGPVSAEQEENLSQVLNQIFERQSALESLQQSQSPRSFESDQVRRFDRTVIGDVSARALGSENAASDEASETDSGQSSQGVNASSSDGSDQSETAVTDLASAATVNPATADAQSLQQAQNVFDRIAVDLDQRLQSVDRRQGPLVAQEQRLQGVVAALGVSEGEDLGGFSATTDATEARQAAINNSYDQQRQAVENLQFQQQHRPGNIFSFIA